MNVTPTSRRWPLFLSIPIFGLFSFCVALFFSLAYLYFLSPESWKNLPPRESGGLSGPQFVSCLSLSAGLSAALWGMFFWKLLILRSWRSLGDQPSHRTILFGGLVGFLELICTPALMWLFYMLFLIGLTRPSLAPHDLALVFPGIGALGVITLIFVTHTSRGLVFLIGIGASIFFALLARRIFS
jgi:hypothetical protein